MTDITVKEFSKTVGLPVNRLIDQLELAGVTKKNENDLISDEEKMQLLNFVRNNQDTKKIDNENTINIFTSMYCYFCNTCCLWVTIQRTNNFCSCNL